MANPAQPTLPLQPNEAKQFLQAQPVETKKALFLLLFHETLDQTSGNALIPVLDQDESLGYIIPPHMKSVAPITRPVLTAEDDAAIAQAMQTPDQTFDVAQYLKDQRSKDAG